MSDHQPRAEDRLNNFTIVMVGGVAALVLWASVVALQGYYASTGGAVADQRATEGQDTEAREVRAQQLAKIAEYRREGQRFAIPIERAMGLVVRDAHELSLVPALGPHNQPTTTPSGAPVPEPAVAPVDGEATVPVEGEAAAPVDGEATASVGGETTPPVEGEVTAPVDGEAVVPAKGTSAPEATVPAAEEADVP